MYKIALVCENGASTGMVVKKMIAHRVRGSRRISRLTLLPSSKISLMKKM